jgi:hypothetical protein
VQGGGRPVSFCTEFPPTSGLRQLDITAPPVARACGTARRAIMLYMPSQPKPAQPSGLCQTGTNLSTRGCQYRQGAALPAGCDHHSGCELKPAQSAWRRREPAPGQGSCGEAPADAASPA